MCVFQHPVAHNGILSTEDSERTEFSIFAKAKCLTVHVGRHKALRHPEIRQSDVAFSLNIGSITGLVIQSLGVWKDSTTVAKGTTLCFI